MPAAPVIATQRQLGRVRTLRIFENKWMLLLSPVLWAPFLVVIVELFPQVWCSASRTPSFRSGFVLANLIIGLALSVGPVLFQQLARETVAGNLVHPRTPRRLRRSPPHGCPRLPRAARRVRARVRRMRTEGASASARIRVVPAQRPLNPIFSAHEELVGTRTGIVSLDFNISFTSELVASARSPCRPSPWWYAIVDIALPGPRRSCDLALDPRPSSPNVAVASSGIAKPPGSADADERTIARLVGDLPPWGRRESCASRHEPVRPRRSEPLNRFRRRCALGTTRADLRTRWWRLLQLLREVDLH